MQNGTVSKVGPIRLQKFVYSVNHITNLFNLSPCRTPTLPACNSPASSSIQTKTPSLASTLPSFATFPCEVCFNLAHSTLDCLLLPQKTIPNTTANNEGHMIRKKEKTGIGASTFLPQVAALITTVVSIAITDHSHRPDTTQKSRSLRATN